MSSDPSFNHQVDIAIYCIMLSTVNTFSKGQVPEMHTDEWGNSTQQAKIFPEGLEGSKEGVRKHDCSF